MTKETIMPRRIIVDNCVLLILWQLIFYNFISAEREILNCMIKDGEIEIHLQWKKTNQLLANENLPIWIAKAGKRASCLYNRGTVQHELQADFMRKNIGPFISYHDLDKSSAVVYYENTKTLHGMIDTRYVIVQMPINECNLGHQVGGKYVKRRRKSMNIHDHLKPLDLSVRRDNNYTPYYGESSNEYETPTKRQRLENTADEKPATIFYPEILIFVPYNSMRYNQDSHPNIALPIIVRHFIIYFNGIDMLLAKLSTDNIKIYLNLAGIVFEDRSNAFDFMIPIDVTVPSDTQPPEEIRYVDVHRTSEFISAYIKGNRNTFPKDSFDFYFVSTKTNLWSTEENNIIHGVSFMNDVYAMRLDSSDKYSPGLIIHHGSLCEYVTAAHEIAHLMNIEHEPQTKGYYNGIKQCYAIMQETNPFCPDCLKWTNQNTEDLQKFAREHRNRCFLLNKPRSLHPHGYPMKSLSRLGQCHCYGYEHWPIIKPEDYMDEVPHTDCDQDLICGQDSNEVDTILPLDGTPCANDKVCWNNVCQTLSYESRLELQGSSSRNI